MSEQAPPSNGADAPAAEEQPVAEAASPMEDVVKTEEEGQVVEETTAAAAIPVEEATATIVKNDSTAESSSSLPSSPAKEPPASETVKEEEEEQEDAVEQKTQDVEMEDDTKTPTATTKEEEEPQQDEPVDAASPAPEVVSATTTPEVAAAPPVAAPAPAPPKEEKKEPQYSTRGRHASRETDQDLLGDRLVDHLSDQVDGATAAAAGKESSVSFLDSLGEDERRTRTRYLPDVDGIHVLYKTEVKQDLVLARTAMSSSGVSSTLKKNGGRQRRGGEDAATAAAAEEPDEDGTPEELSSDSATYNTTGGAPNGAATTDTNATSRAFVAPSAEQLNIHNIDGEDGKTSTTSPHVIEVVTAFDPPRPPESVGPKKKHRLLRWERRSQDVQVDLDSYRKTVTRTRTELHNAQAERVRINAVSAHLRAHFLSQGQALDLEGRLLDEELSNVQLDCVKAADLLQSRTRSRGAGKGSYVMKDVLNILKQKGADVANLATTMTATIRDSTAVVAPVSGVGGVSSKSFKDWERGDPLQPDQPSNGWIVPGNTVQTPYGKGEVVHVFEPTDLDVTATPVEGSVLKPSKPTPPPQHGFGSTTTAMDADVLMSNGGGDESSSSSPKEKKKKRKDNKTLSSNHKTPTNVSHLLAPRVCVKLPFGVGFFSTDTVTAAEDVSCYSDSDLAARWSKMTETALSMAGCIDFAAMAHVDDNNDDKNNDDDNNNNQMEQCSSDDVTMEDATDVAPKTDDRFLPFGSNLLPTSCGRGARLHDAPLLALEQGLDFGLFHNEAILGHADNRGVSEKFRQWEDYRDELSILRAQVLHRRNQLARQRRVRAHNERAFATTRDKSLRVENLVSEMRADLKSLKDRLDYELVELGIDGDRAENLLLAHYNKEDAAAATETAKNTERHHRSDNHHNSNSNTSSPSNNKRRAARHESTDDELDNTTTTAAPAAKRARPSQ